MKDSLQDTYAPHNKCFGCGPDNEQGLQLKSFPEENGDSVVAEFMPQAHHQAFPGIVNGGIIGTILDCHSNWTAAYSLMKEKKLDTPPCTVTADYHVKLYRPTDLSKPISLRAKVDKIDGDKAHIEAELWSENKKTASCKGMFVAVKPGHPAYHAW